MFLLFDGFTFKFCIVNHLHLTIYLLFFKTTLWWFLLCRVTKSVWLCMVATVCCRTPDFLPSIDLYIAEVGNNV